MNNSRSNKDSISTNFNFYTALSSYLSVLKTTNIKLNYHLKQIKTRFYVRIRMYPRRTVFFCFLFLRRRTVIHRTDATELYALGA